jgi:ATP-dependent helicase YprA (DUF1998 family)
MSMNPRETTDKIRDDYKSYVSSILSVRDPEITRLAREEVDKTEFVKGPFLEATLPFEDGHTLKELAEEGLVSKEFSKMGKSVHYDEWKLRIHQEKALRHIIADKRNMVVSTGTGSGKTECYLYPIFNELMREKEQGVLNSGVRALLIFPMNALANDQQKKLRGLLKDYPDITFGRYTGETSHSKNGEDPDAAEKRLHEEYDASHQDDSNESERKSIPNELMCREYMAQNPPHILLTNYAMLEYMLLRPDTAPFFDTEKAAHWQFLVIDEAHSYKGAVGTEIAFLLRRLKERISKFNHGKFRCIATSATLGSDDGKADLAKFAEELFGEPFSAEDVITTKRKHRIAPDHGRDFMPEDYRKIKAILDIDYKNASDEKKGKYLFSILKDDTRLFKIYSALQDGPEDIEEVADKVFSDLPDKGTREHALIDLIELAAAAKENEFESALLPARYHLFVRSLEGLFAELYPQKQVFLNRKEKTSFKGKEYRVFELANCEKCGQEYIVGKVTRDDKGRSYISQTSSIDKPDFFFISNQEINENLDEDDDLDEKGNISSLHRYHLCLACGRLTDYSEAPNYNCCDVADHGKLVSVYNLKYTGKAKESNCCPCCGATKAGLIKKFLTANQPATFAVASSLYEAIPPRPLHKHNDASEDSDFDIFADNLFADDAPINQVDEKVIDESGRKLLIFSDNRQEAAFFAGYFEKQYRLIMWRKIILESLQETSGHELSVDDLISIAKQKAEKEGLFSLNLGEQDQDAYAMSDEQKKQMAAHYVMKEFISPDIATGLEGMGYIQIYPDPIHMKESAQQFGIHGSDIWNVYRFVFDTLRQKGTVSFPSNISPEDDFFAPRNHSGFFRKSGSEKLRKKGYVYGFMPSEGKVNKRLSLFAKLLKQSGVEDAENTEAVRQLDECYRVIMGTRMKPHYIRESQEASSGMIYELNYKSWRFRYNEPTDKVYRCKKCGKVFNYSINGLCPELKCDGQLEEIEAGKLRKNSYRAHLYEDKKFIPMVAREHTAQLSAQTARRYQEMFEEGAINVLSCSTTFEMGVDVGELEATFQRNVPPETSNYIQRAGRAGRRTSSAAFSVTFARRNSHDMTFFQNPAEIIAGKIKAPVLEINNEKIAQRHLNSVVVSRFFKKHPAFFEGRAKRIAAYDDKDSMELEMRAYLDEHPEDLLQEIHGVFSEEVCKELGVDEWKFENELVGPDGCLTLAVKQRQHDIEGLREFDKSIREGNAEGEKTTEYRKALAAARLEKTLNDEPSISFLSAKGVLPKYGFPIDTVSLDILNNTDEAKKIDLSRDLRMAISEFAPPAQVVANGKLWQSYAINTIPDKSWPTYVYYECPKCKRIYPPEEEIRDVTYNVKSQKKECPECGAEMDARKFIIPIFGFSTAYFDKPKQVGDTKPRSYYSTQTQFWGDSDLTERQQKDVMEQTLSFSGKDVIAKYSPGGKLFALNQGTTGAGLFVCPECGYTTEPGKISKSGKHKNKFGSYCSNTVLQQVSLGHQFTTDILKITLPSHEIELKGVKSAEPKNQELSLLYAILEGAASALDINRSDINGCVTSGNTLILYDDTPGGSGFAKQIYQNLEKVLRHAKQKVDGSCGCTEETSCYGCLRNYSNQHFHDVLSRGLAYHYLDWLLSGSATRTEKIGMPSSEHKEQDINDSDEIDDSMPEVGSRTIAGFDADSYSTKTVSVPYLEQQLMEDAQTDLEKEKAQQLIEIIKETGISGAVVLDPILIDEGSIYPAVFWPKQHVAVFWADESGLSAYRNLKTYDWHCYLINEDFDVSVMKGVLGGDD